MIENHIGFHVQLANLRVFVYFIQSIPSVYMPYFATCFFGATVDCIIFNMLYTHIGIHMY